MSLPLALLPYATPPYTKMTDAGLVPNSFGKLLFFVTGTSTPLPTYQDQNGDSAHSHPIVLDANGFPAVGSTVTPIYLLPQGYALTVTDSDDVEITSQSIDFVEDVGSAFLAQSANIQAEGTQTVTTPYIVLATDNTVEIGVAAPGGFVVQLQAAADRGTPLLAKNYSASAVALTPQGTETCDGSTSPYMLPAASGDFKPSVLLFSNGISGYVVLCGIAAP